MFGYVLPDKPNMFMKDYAEYRAFYCGLCKSIGKKCSNVMRFTTNYDITFLNVLYHALYNKDVQISEEGCVLNPFKKKPIVKDDELTRDIIDVNNILAHYKCQDDVIDNKSGSKWAFDKLVLNKHYKRSRVNFENIDKLVSVGYEKLRELEKANCSSIDRVADPFANIMKGIAKELFREKYTENIGDMMYALGKWVYLCDAIDDIDEDYVGKKFNLFLADYDYIDKKTFLVEKHDDLEFALNSSEKTISDCFAKLKIEKYEGVLTNILWYGLKAKTKDILSRSEKCKKIRI